MSYISTDGQRMCLLQRHNHSQLCAQDVKCAFPNHPWLQDAEGQAALRRVLAAFSMHNPKVGYTR